LGLLALMISVMAGCGGSGKDGAAGPAGSSAGGYTVPVGDNSVSPTAASIAAWKALAPQVTVTGVSIASPPVVSFTVKDAAGNAIVGLGNKSKSSSAVVAGLTNMYFTLAKLVPVTGGPSKWVTYLVTKPVATGTSKAVVNGGVSWLGTYPTSDKEGTLVDNGDGSYQYTFYRDVKEAANIANVLDDTADSTGYSKKADLDLGNLVFNASQTHRLGIVIGGAAPGTGSNTPNGSTAIPGVNMENVANVVYDFRPDGGAISTRDIVKIDSCADCHKGKVLAHGSRKDPKFCVTCHTAQIIYSFNAGEALSSPDGLTLTGGYTGSTQQKRAETAIVGGRAVGNFNNLIHKMHMGKELVKTGYYFNADDAGKFNEVGFPQDQRNCTKCHDGSATKPDGSINVNKTANGDNWKNVPSRLACGACHDGIDFATGAGVTLADKAKDKAADALSFALNAATGTPYVASPVGTTKSGHGSGVPGALTSDSTCGSCHGAAEIMLYHIPVTASTPVNALTVPGGSGYTNAAAIASNTSNLPAGAIKVTYDIKSVSRNASKQPVMVFRILQNGSPVVFNDPATNTEIWPNFMGSPSVYFVYAVPQDGIITPADFNGSASAYLRDLWNCNGTGCLGSQGTLAYDTATGYYTATITTTYSSSAGAASAVTIPDSAVMLTGGLGYTYSLATTMPLTQTNVAGYPTAASTVAQCTTAKNVPYAGCLPAVCTSTALPLNAPYAGCVVKPMPNQTGGLIVVAPDAQKVATGYTGRRAIVEDARCNKCHQELGLFTDESFHGGQRNDGSTCAWCHNPNRTSSGWGADSTNFIHGIHGASKRTTPFTWHAASITEGFWTLGYPGVLKKCETCHLPGTYDFSASASASALPNKQFRTVASGTISKVTGTTLAKFSISPYVNQTVSTNYGSGFSVDSAGSAVQAVGTTLVDSPITTVCFACHDSTLAIAHMTGNGGAIYEARSTALVKTEQCMLCHGSGKVADIKAMHEK
jgi:OmcA/MtrC family decaheme c-type cytochrome